MLDPLCLTRRMLADPRPQPLTPRPRGAAREGVFAPVSPAVPEVPRRRTGRITTTALALALLAGPAAAQRLPRADDTVHARAIAAGYKAAMLCSGMFVAGRSQREVETTELRGIYPEYDAIVPTLTARVNRRFGWVEVLYDKEMPPRLSMWRDGEGCTTYEPGLAPPPTFGDVLPPIYTPPSGQADPRSWPAGDAGVAPRPSPALAAVVDRAFAGAAYGSGTRTVGVVVVRDGIVAAERYGQGFGPFVPNRTWSVAKSITGTLVGISRVDVNARADIPEWPCQGTREGGCLTLKPSITLDQLLRMSSGLHSDTAGNRTDAVYFGGVPVTRETVSWPLDVRPGTRFRYANNDILLAVRSLRATVGEERYRALPRQALFGPLGMTHTIAEKDGAGNFILSSQVWSTARDLARLGQFWLEDGVWQGKRLLPEGWMRYMTTPSGPQPPDAPAMGRPCGCSGRSKACPPAATPRRAIAGSM